MNVDVQNYDKTYILDSLSKYYFCDAYYIHKSLIEILTPAKVNELITITSLPDKRNKPLIWKKYLLI